MRKVDHVVKGCGPATETKKDSQGNFVQPVSMMGK
jgi:hypothetical protein